MKMIGDMGIDERFVDLHIHTTKSDGHFTPQEVVRKAVKSGLAQIAITDHDTIDGYLEAKEIANNLNLSLMVGAEFSSTIGNKAVHILGYCFDILNPQLLEVLESVKHRRIERFESIVRKLGKLGYPLPIETAKTAVQGKIPGRAHIARLLVKHKYFNSVDDVFNKILGENMAAYEPSTNMSPENVIRVIKEADGVCSLAHPQITAVDQHIGQFVDAGLDAIEVYSTHHNRQAIAHYKKIADKYQLLTTGGSDFHGIKRAGKDIGDYKLPLKFSEELEQLATRNILAKSGALKQDN